MTEPSSTTKPTVRFLLRIPAADGLRCPGKASPLVTGLLSQLLHGIFEFFSLHFTPTRASLGQGTALSWSHSTAGM